jgi:general secretion pathway protein D
VEDGETIVLGGIVKETDKFLRRRVPGFSLIPLIGGLFQKVSKEREKVDFIILLTPQIIQNTEETREATSKAALAVGSAGLNSADLSPAEAEVDRRFRELYRKSGGK